MRYVLYCTNFLHFFTTAVSFTSFFCFQCFVSQLRTKKQNSCNLCIFSYCYIWMLFCSPSFSFLFHKPKQQATVPQCHLISIKKANPPTISASLSQQTLWGFRLPTLKDLFLLNPCLNNCKTWLNSFATSWGLKQYAYSSFSLAIGV